MLSLKGISKSFEGFYALDDVSLAVEEGESHAIIGPNGAGKTTLFNVITGHVKRTTGSVELFGEDITNIAPHRIVGKGLARSFQRINIFPQLSVYQNVQVAHIARHKRQFGLFRPARRLFQSDAMRTLEDVGLETESNATAGTLAYGKQKQLELAITLASKPKLLLLDEPTAGMSPSETTESLDLIDKIRAEYNLSLLFTEHDMQVVFRISDKVTVLHHGQVIATGTPQEVRNDENVIRVYLGAGKDGIA